MMASRWNAGLLATVIVLAAATASAQEEGGGLYQPRDPCPHVERIVRDAVNEEHKRNNQITAGFLRIFFHDCFSGGCDASILLDEEWNDGVNKGTVQPRVRQLVNEIRAKVEKECGKNAVSCADILALGTRDSVAAAKGPAVTIHRGRFDSKVPQNTDLLPGPGLPINALLRLFSDFGLKDPADLVALSGGHTVGRTKLCFLVRPDFEATCSVTGVQMLDVITPNEFDNQYFVGLTQGKGVFDSDQGLLSNPSTANLVRDFAKDKNTFFRQWGASFTKLSHVNWTAPSKGEIRDDCTKPNRRPRLDEIIIQEVATTASA